MRPSQKASHSESPLWIGLKNGSYWRENGLSADIPSGSLLTQADIGADGEIWSVASTEEMTANDLTERHATGSDVFVRCRMPPCTFLPACCEAVGAIPQPSSRKAVANNGPMLSIVPPCFGQTGLECGAGQRVVDPV